MALKDNLTELGFVVEDETEDGTIYMRRVVGASVFVHIQPDQLQVVWLPYDAEQPTVISSWNRTCEAFYDLLRRWSDDSVEVVA